MEFFPKTETPSPKCQKFGKCSSFSSLGTEAEAQQRNECIPRKISD